MTQGSRHARLRCRDAETVLGGGDGSKLGDEVLARFVMQADETSRVAVVVDGDDDVVVLFVSCLFGQCSSVSGCDGEQEKLSRDRGGIRILLTRRVSSPSDTVRIPSHDAADDDDTTAQRTPGLWRSRTRARRGGAVRVCVGCASRGHSAIPLTKSDDSKPAKPVRLRLESQIRGLGGRDGTRVPGHVAP